eukprot:475584-Pleurochrysis_carterae.AAC.1
MVIKSDDGSAFLTELMRAFAKYAGLRRAFVLSYNAPANGMAEQAMAPIARLLVRHTQQFRNWPDTLPMVAFALNCTEHLSTGVSPFFAIYGHHLISLPELDNPSLFELAETRNEFVDTLATLRDASESIRLDAAARANAHHRRWLKPNTMDFVGRIQVGDRVLLRHDSVEYTALLKKHGFLPLRSFGVLEVIPEYNALRADTR